jgi:pimeloyl-ACP methyl ester carboxylesterase
VIASLDVHGRLGEIGCPALVVVGERDPITPPSVAQELVQAIRGAKIVVIPDASHIVTVEVPVAVNEAMALFLGARENWS